MGGDKDAEGSTRAWGGLRHQMVDGIGGSIRVRPLELRKNEFTRECVRQVANLDPHIPIDTIFDQDERSYLQPN